MVEHNEDEDDDLEDDPSEEQGEDPTGNKLAYVKFHPEDIDQIFDAVHSGIDLLHTIMANLYEGYQNKVIDYDVLKTEVDTKNAELNKYKDQLLTIYSQSAVKQTKRKKKE
jgi:hypothetical protein